MLLPLAVQEDENIVLAEARLSLTQQPACRRLQCAGVCRVAPCRPVRPPPPRSKTEERGWSQGQPYQCFDGSHLSRAGSQSGAHRGQQTAVGHGAVSTPRREGKAARYRRN